MKAILILFLKMKRTSEPKFNFYILYRRVQRLITVKL